MTDLLPIVFSRGQNESIDPRVAPPEVHAVARNVRWRKDGRPAKRYGSALVSTAPFATLGYNQQPVNAITRWNDVPVLALGSSVRQQSTLGFAPEQPSLGNLALFAPGKHDIVSHDESISATSASAGTSQGMVLYAWSDGAQVYYSVKSTSGATVVQATATVAGKDVRCISTANYIYILSKNGTTLDLRVFDPTTLAVTAGPSPGTLNAAADHFDACGRGSDFLVAYHSAGNFTTKLFTAVLVPVLSQTQNAGAVVAETYLGVAGNATSNVFLASLDVATGVVTSFVFNNALTAFLGGVVVNADVNNGGQPGVGVLDNATAEIVWSGFVAASESSYIRAGRVTSAGLVFAISAPYYGVSLASKPFMGPAVAGSPSGVDRSYAWVASHNANNGSQKWDDQRAYYLIQYQPSGTVALRRQAHVPNIQPWTLGQNLLTDVLALGTGIGFLTPLVAALRFGNGGNELRGVDSVSVRSIFESMRTAARDTVTAGRVLQFSGGSLFELNGLLEETGFSNAPVIQSVAGGGGGGLTGATNYIYRAVYEYIDAQGRRHRSAPSDPLLFASGANSSATLTLKPLVANSHQFGVAIHVYRTIAGQSSFHRITPNSGAPGPTLGVATVAYVDLMSDATAAGQEFIYTDGGVADNTLCPPHTFHTVCSGRLWVGGQLDRCVLTASKLLVDGEPTQFSDLESFSVFLPEECTGAASIDGTVVAFAREKIYFITGDGPNDQGIGSFNPPTELPTDVGCIDWRSVVESSVGIFFQGKRGVYLLPRGFNTPVFIGAEVESTLADFPIIASATLVVQPSSGSSFLGEITVRFVALSDESGTISRVLVYDLRTGGWSVDSGPVYGPAGTWSDTFVFSTSTGAGVFGTLRAETPGAYVDPGSVFIPTTLGTGDIRPFGVAGYGGFDSVVLVGEYRATSIVNVQVSVDGATPDTFAFPVGSADGQDGSVYLDVTPKIRMGSSIRVTCSDATIGPNNEGFIMQALFIEHETIGKTKRLAQARRA